MLRYRYIPDRSKKASPRSQEPSLPPPPAAQRSTSLSPYPTVPTPHHVDDNPAPISPRSSPLPPSGVQARPPLLQFSQSTSVTSQLTSLTPQGTTSTSQPGILLAETPPCPRDLFHRVSPSPIVEHPDFLLSAPGVSTAPATSSPRHPRRATSLTGKTATSSPRIPRRAATVAKDTARLTGKDSSSVQVLKKVGAFVEESETPNLGQVFVSKGAAFFGNDLAKMGCRDGAKFIQDDGEIFGKEGPGCWRCCEDDAGHDSMWDGSMDVQDFRYRFGDAYFEEQESTMYGQHGARRRKKRPMGHGIKNVQVSRGRHGYGFTISGQHPCVLSCIVPGSPAEMVGLKAGDYLYFVNGVNVSHAPHDDVVCMVGQSTGTLDLQVAENYNSSDSSEEDYLPRSKSRYPNRVRFRQTQGDPGGRGGIASRPLPQRPVDVRGNHSRPYRNHVPVGADSDLSTSVTSPGSSLSEERSRQDHLDVHGWKRPVYEKIGRHSNSYGKIIDSSTTDMSAEGLAFTMATVQNGPVISTAKISSAASKRPPSRSKESVNPLAAPSSAIQDNAAVASSSQEASAEPEAIPEVTEREEEEDGFLTANRNEARAVVGYIGSIELPGNVNRPNQRLQQLRSAVRRLRVEQKIHTLVLMEVDASGVRLSNGIGGTVAHYTVDKLAFSGICPDDKRFFGIVTLNSASDDISEFSGHTDGSPSSSCHVFMVDPDMSSHVLHVHKAKAFNLICTPSADNQHCSEFPHSPTHLILCIANLYRDRPRSKLDSDIIQSHAFTDPSRPAQRSSSNSSNSDSGLGFGREEPHNEQVCVVDMQEEVAAASSQALLNDNAVSRNLHTPSASVSRSLGSLQQHLSPGVYSINTPQGLHRPMSAFEVRRGLNNSSSSEECWAGQGRVDKLTPRAMPDPTTRCLPRATSTDGLERNPSAESLRQSMQRLLQARQQQLQQEQAISSDGESQVSSNVHASHTLAAQSAFQVPRPVSAPLRVRGRRQQSETVDMGFGKLSPRAFQQPSNVIRSPSAPPIAYFPHQDPDEDEDDTESEDDPFVRTIISQFNRDRVLDFGEENPRRFSEGYALGKQREKERAEREELQKWTKTGSFRRSHNMKLKANVSQSHESLAVGEGEGCSPGGGPGGRLAGANSVNNIVTPHHQVLDEEDSGRVAGWAVGFQRLLGDPAGVAIFTEFLKKEFSEENIVFWSAVESFKQITDDEQRRSRAHEIYKNHLSSQASDPVNVDSTARQLTEHCLENPTPTMFDVAQQQIFQLMRTDSYSRFLKSDLYKGHLMREMEGQPLSIPNIMPPPQVLPHDTKKKGKGKENDEKRRKSLLPWKQNKKSSLKESKGKGKDKEEGGGKGKGKEKEVNNNQKKGPGPGIDLSTMRKEVFQPAETEAAESGEVKFCRVVMPDTSTTVVCTRPGLNIRSVLGKLCEKRNLSIASVDVFLLGSDKPLDLEEDISALGSKEVMIERRVLFRLDLPNHKSIGVKAKPNRSIRDVFKPILNKYGHRIDSCGVQLSGMPEFLDLDIPVSDLDNQRVIVVANPENAENTATGHVPQQPLSSRHRRTPLLHLPSRSRGAGSKGGSLEEITNQIFDDLMKGKSELAHAFDELGVVDLERGGKANKNADEPRSLGLFGLLRKESWGTKDPTKQKGKGRVTFALPRSDSKKKAAALAKAAEEERLMEELAHAHRQQLEEEWRSGSDHKSTPMTDMVASDCVETVDMATHTEGSLGLAPARGDMGLDGDHPVLPPPDMFDDVHYMHSLPVDTDHPSQDEREDLVDDVPPLIQLSTPRFSTFGTPRSKASHSAAALLSKGAASPSAEEPNPYLPMQPVIVDSNKKESSHSRSNVQSQTLGETVSPHFDSVSTFRPTKVHSAATHKAPTASPERYSPEKQQAHDPEKPSDTEIPKDPLRPIPARRRLLDQSASNKRSASPRSPQSDVTTPAPGTSSQLDITNVRTTSEAPNSRASVVSPRVDIDQTSLRVGTLRHSPKSGSAVDIKASSPASTPSPTHPPQSPVSAAQQEGAPRYTSPPPYATAVGHRQGHSSRIKSSPSPPVYSSGIPSAHARSSPPAVTSPRKLSSPSGTTIMRSMDRDQSHYPGTKDTPRDVASPRKAVNRNCHPHGLVETPRDQGNSEYSSSDPHDIESSAFGRREAGGKSSPNGSSQTPRDSMASPTGGRQPTPRERSNSYGTRLVPRNHSRVHQAVVTPRDSSSPYKGFSESPRNSTQTEDWNRGSGSWDSVITVKECVSAIEQTVKSPRNSVQNGSVVHPSYSSGSVKSFYGHTAPKILSPRESSHLWAHSVEGLSQHPSSHSRSVNSSTVVVAADVHHQPPQRRTSPPDRRPFARPLSGTLDASVYSEQTVTFV